MPCRPKFTCARASSPDPSIVTITPSPNLVWNTPWPDRKPWLVVRAPPARPRGRAPPRPALGGRVVGAGVVPAGLAGGAAIPVTLAAPAGARVVLVQVLAGPTAV